MVSLQISVNSLEENGTEKMEKIDKEFSKDLDILDFLKECVGEDYDDFNALEIWCKGWLLWNRKDDLITTLEEILKKCDQNNEWEVYDNRMKRYEKMLENVDNYQSLYGPIPVSPRFNLSQEPLFIKLSINGVSFDARISECNVTHIKDKLAEKCHLKELMDPRFGDFSLVFSTRPIGLVHKAPIQIGPDNIPFPVAITEGDDEVVLGKDFLTYLDVTVDFSKMELSSPKLANSPIPMFSKKAHKDIGLIFGKHSILKTEKSKINTVPPAKREEIEPFIKKIHEKYEEELADLNWKSCRLGVEKFCSCVVM